jgi:sugar phosphate isomerase/epimerase
MKLLVFRHNWGLTESSWAEKLQKIKNADYVGMETGALKAVEYDRFRELLAKFNLLFIPQIFTSGATVAEHVASLRGQLDAVRPFQPLRVNYHSGSDAWSVDDAARFYREAQLIEADSGLNVCHETHRGRCFYNPWATVRLLENFPRLNLCADFSHWVCVCERLLNTEENLVRFCASRAIHIHARVGYENGPQVTDPRAPEWKLHLEAHEQWWRWICEAQMKRGAAELTLTPEFGPPSYLHTLPYTQTPVANVEEISDWQAKRQIRNFHQWTGQTEPSK